MKSFVEFRVDSDWGIARLFGEEAAKSDPVNKRRIESEKFKNARQKKLAKLRANAALWQGLE